MEFEKIKESLTLPKNIKEENIKTYLIHENINSIISNNAKTKNNIFSNIGLNMKILTSNSNFSTLYDNILTKAKDENELHYLLSKLNKKIEKKYSIDTLQKDAINSLNSDSSFYISIGNTDQNIKFINATLENNILTFDWDYNRKELSDETTIENFKKIVLSHKQDLFNYTNKQKNIDKKLLRNLILKGQMKNSLQGNIDTLKISIYPELTSDDDALNNSYFKLKDEVISLLENNLNKAKDIK